MADDAYRGSRGHECKASTTRAARLATIFSVHGPDIVAASAYAAVWSAWLAFAVSGTLGLVFVTGFVALVMAAVAAIALDDHRTPAMACLVMAALLVIATAGVVTVRSLAGTLDMDGSCEAESKQ